MKVFDDWKSIIHFIVGLIAGLNTQLAIPITLIFIIYQMLEKEPFYSKLGDVVEYVLGLIIGVIICIK